MIYRRSTLIKIPIFPIVIAVALLTLTAFAAFRGQRTAPTQDSFDESQFPIFEEYSARPKNKEERAKSELKAKRFRLGSPVVSLPHWGVVAGVHHWPANFSPLPVAESTTIIIGDVVDATANLSDDRTAVYSDFTIKPINILKDTCKIAKENSLITASRYGGRVKFQDGHALLVFMSNLGMPRVGQRYLFFLKQTDADFDIVTAYEIKGDRVTPLDSGTSNFDSYKNASGADVINEVEQKIKSLSQTTLNSEDRRPFSEFDVNTNFVLFLFFDSDAKQALAGFNFGPQNVIPVDSTGGLPTFPVLTRVVSRKVPLPGVDFTSNLALQR